MLRFRINRQGGFAHATSDQVVNLGFAAFGAVPEVGSAFKTVFKPMWKERRAARGAVHSGLDAVEMLLGMRKGGAIAWVRQELLGKWTARTQQAVTWVNTALEATTGLLEFMATAGGWKDWLIPDPIQAMARELLPSLKRMRTGIDSTMKRASNEMREFLADLLGEQAAAVAMAVGERTVQASAMAGTRSRNGHNAADVRPHGTVPPRQPTREVQTQARAQAEKGHGPVHASIQVTRKALRDLATREKGLIGEHVADYHELRRLTGSWPHDVATGRWEPAAVHKLNVDKRPVNLSLLDLPKVNQPGIDAVWEHGGHYTVTEAKASESIAAAYGFGKYKERKGLIPIVSGLNSDQQLLHYLLSDGSDKGGVQGPLMQMSKAWVKDRGQREGLPRAARDAIKSETYLRRVLLVTIEAARAHDHAAALADIHLGKVGDEVRYHVEHGISREWEAAAIDMVDEARRAAHKAKRRAAPAHEAPAPSPPEKPTRSRRPGA